MVGVVKLAESGQKVILGSFVYNGLLYHLMRGYKDVYVATIKDGELTKVLQISEDNINPTNLPFNRGNELIVPIIMTDSQVNGYIKVVGNTITVVKTKV